MSIHNIRGRSKIRRTGLSADERCLRQNDLWSVSENFPCTLVISTLITRWPDNDSVYGKLRTQGFEQLDVAFLGRIVGVYRLYWLSLSSLPHFRIEQSLRTS